MNYEELLSIPYKTCKVFLIIVFLVLIIFGVIINFKVCDVYNTYAYYKEGNLVLNIPLQYSDTLLNAQYFKVEEEKYDMNILYVSDILIDSTTKSNYQEVILDFPSSLTENMVVNINIYYDQEKVLKKLLELL